MNKKLNKYLRLACVIALWLVLIVACLRAYNLYQYNKLHPQNEYSWTINDPFSSGPPEEYIIKMEMMEATRNMILIGVLFAIIWEVLLFFDDPEKHFATYWYRKTRPVIEKIGSKLEDDEEDEDEGK